MQMLDARTCRIWIFAALNAFICIGSGMKEYPKTHSEHNRLLAMICSFNLGHIDPLVLSINEYVSMCESGGLVCIRALQDLLIRSHHVRMGCNHRSLYRNGMERFNAPLFPIAILLLPH